VHKEAYLNEIKYLKATITSHKATLFITIEEEDETEVPYRIENRCEGVDISVYQSRSSPSKGILVKPGQILPWSWRYPSEKGEVIVDFITKSSSNYHFSQSRFNFDKLDQPLVTEIYVGSKERIKVLSKVTIEGVTRVLKFSLLPESGPTKEIQYRRFSSSSSEEEEIMVNYDIDVNLPHIGISVITNIEEKFGKKAERKEAAYCRISGLRLKVVETNEKRFYYLTVNNLIMNNNLNYMSHFPVVLAPTEPRELNHYGGRKFLDLTLIQRHKAKVVLSCNLRE